MHTHRTALWRWLCTHRRELALGTAFVTTAAVVLFAALPLLLVALLERRADPRRRQLLGLRLLSAGGRALTWLWIELHGAPHGRWHPCTQCGRPIAERSRAMYCSFACRRYARLERDAAALDPRIAERAERRLKAIRLRELADERPEWNEVPF